MSHYLKKYEKTSAEQVDAGASLLFTFFESLNEDDWVEFLGDLVHGRPPAIEVVMPPRGEDLLAYGASLLEGLGKSTQRLLGRALERGLQRSGSEKITATGFSRTLDLVTVLPDTVSPSFLKNLVVEPGIALKDRMKAAEALAGYSEPLPPAFWQGIALDRYPDLTPAVFSGLGVSSPMRALGLLKQMESSPGSVRRLEYPLRLVLRRLLYSAVGLDEFVEFRRSAPSWLAELLDYVLSFDEFSSQRDLINEAKTAVMTGSVAKTRASSCAPVSEAIEHFRQGGMVIVVDDEDCENDGDLVIAAEKITPEAISFMAKYGRGLICLSLTEKRCEELKLPLMVEDSFTGRFGTAFTVSIEARGKVTTGISANDRAATVRTAIDPATKPQDLIRPGHVFPVRAGAGGVLKRAGHTEASIDLAVLAGLAPGAVICEIMNDDGSIAQLADLEVFSREHDLPLLAVSDLISHRLQTETLVRRIAAPRIPTAYGEFVAHAYTSDVTGEDHVAFVAGEIDSDEPILVRVHNQCLTGDIFGSGRCDCGPQLHNALESIRREGRGVLLYLLQEGRGVGLVNKLKAYELQEQAHDTVEAAEKLGLHLDHRNYGIGCQILRDLGVRKMRLMTNNPGKYVAIQGYGLEIVERIPFEVPSVEPERKNVEPKRKSAKRFLRLV